MDEVEILEVKRTILEDNDKDAMELSNELKKDKILYINVMSSPGSGKTSTLLAIIEKLKKYRIGVMEADIDGDVDARVIASTGTKSIQLHTGGMCHLDASMSRQGIQALGKDDIDILFLENVGNLVCPAEFKTGASLNVTILSVPEGDDKPFKYPLIFSVSDLVIINKIDTIEYFDFDINKCENEIKRLNPNVDIILASATDKVGIDEIVKWISDKYKGWIK